MNVLTNLQLLNQTRFDSGALSGLGAVVHRFTQPGEHRLTVLQADQPVHALSLSVLQPAARPPVQPPQPQPGRLPVEPPHVTIPGQPTGGVTGLPPSPELPMQVHVNLGTAMSVLGQPAPLPQPGTLQVGAQGYAVFFAPAGVQALAVQAHAPGSDEVAFDSRRLQNGDIFTITLLRPGRYSLKNTTSGAQGQIRVAYPVVGDTPYRPPDPLAVQCNQNGFEPNDIQLKPAQGLIFHISNTTARIEIELAEPDDGPQTGPQPGPGPRPLASHWERPGPPGG